MDNIFYDIGIVIVIATLIASIAKAFRQPLIPSYILAGFLIGPSVLGLINDPFTISILSEIGIAFLLFVVGMELDFKRLKNIGYVASLGTTIQVLLLFGVGYLVAFLFPIFSPMERLYIGVIVALSSTMVVVKILTDRKELNTLHGRIIIGILLMQDVFAIIALSTLSTLDNITVVFFALAVVKAALILVTTVIISKYIFPHIFKFAAHSHELLLLTSITVCFVFAMVLHWLGFSIAVGGFLAGIALGNLPYKLEISSKIRSLKDFFATIFFVSLGMELNLSAINGALIPALIIVGAIVILKPVLIMLTTSLFGYSKKTIFLTGMSLAQISEFSLIIVASGSALGHIGENIFGLTIMVAVLTITISTYYMRFPHGIYQAFSGGLNIFDKISKSRNKEIAREPKQGAYKAIIIGYSLLGYSITRKFKAMKMPFLVIDFNPDIIRKLMHEHVNCVYGDVSDSEILEKINFKEAEIVVSTIPHVHDNKMLIQKVKSLNPKVQIFVTSDSVHNALSLYDEGADYVILPHFLGGDHVSLMLEEVTPDINKLIATKLKHIEELHQRKELGHEHPFGHRPKQHH